MLFCHNPRYLAVRDEAVRELLLDWICERLKDHECNRDDMAESSLFDKRQGKAQTLDEEQNGACANSCVVSPCIDMFARLCLRWIEVGKDEYERVEPRVERKAILDK